MLAAPKAAACAQVRWYIVPAVNPDGAAQFFARPQRQDGRNTTPVDDDKDGAFDEDDLDDLDGDGRLGWMYLPDPDGDWVIPKNDAEACGDLTVCLPHPFDATRDTGTRYLRLPEGRDDDGDGLWNEDGPGGVIVGRNFPHAFAHWTADSGRWAADQPETRALLEFAFAHRDIAMILVLGSSNSWREGDFLNDLLKDLSKASSNGGPGTYRLSERQARHVGAPAGREFTLAEVVELLKEARHDPDLDARQARRWLQDGPAKRVQSEDLVWWQAIARSYRSWCDSVGLAGERLPSPEPGPGSVSAWGYYQFGVPTFAVDFWSLPVAKADTAEAAADSSAANMAAPDTAPSPDSADVADDDADPPRASAAWRALAAFSAQAANDPDLADWSGLLPWRTVDLPDGRTVRTGGAAPFCFTTPPAALVDSLLTAQVPFLLTLPDWLPRLRLAELDLKPLHGDVYELEAVLGNDGPVAYPTEQGLRTRQVPPIVVTVTGGDVLEGRARQVVGEVPARGTAKVRWVLRLKPGAELTVQAEAPSLGRVARTVTADSEGGR